MTKLKTLKNIEKIHEQWEHEGNLTDFIYDLKQETIKLIENLQGPNTIYPLILESFPDDMKGELAKDKWNNTMFRYGAEYGMLAFIKHFFNITKEDLK